MTANTSRNLAALASFLFLMGCAAVGPDYVPPETKAPEAWRSALQDGLVQAKADPETLAQWWTTLNDPILSGLMARAVEDGLDVREARARVREARARRGVSQAGRFPSLDASAGVARSRSSENAGGGTETTLYTLGFDAGWEIDVFGGVRRSVEAAEADLAAAEADLNKVTVSLLAEVALNYVEARTYQTRLLVAGANIKAQTETYQLNKSRFEAGLSDELAVQQALYNLESTKSQTPTLRAGLEAALNRLAVLLGRRPGEVHQEMAECRPLPVPPATVAVGVPADALRQRPDVQAAERRVAAQTARIGAAVADLYPKFSLSGAIGLESLTENDWLKTASRTWRIAPGVSWNVFDAGAVRRNIDVQDALQEQALIQYESVVLSALEEVENAITAYAEEQVRREALVAATDAARKAALLARDQFQAGLIDFSSVLLAQRSLLSFQDDLARSDGAVTSNFVRLYKALGGGWAAAQ